MSRSPQPLPAHRNYTAIVAAFRALSLIGIGITAIALGRAVDAFLGDAPIPAWLAVVGIVLAGVGAYGEIVAGTRISMARERQVRSQVVRAYISTPTPSITPGAAVTLSTENAEKFAAYTHAYLGSTLAAFIAPVAALAYIAVAIDWVIGLGVLLGFILVPAAIISFYRAFRGRSRRSRMQRGRLSGQYLDALRNLVTIRLLGAGERVEARLRAEGEKNRRSVMRMLAGNQIVIIVVDGLIGLGLITLTAALTAWRADTLGEAMTCILLIFLVIEPVKQASGFFYIGMGGIASRKAIAAFLHGNPLGRKREESVAKEGVALELDDVSFTYPGADAATLSGLNLSVRAGERLAISAPSGSGKSTLLNVLAGRLAADAGLVARRGEVAMVTQATWLFTGTVADNLRIARPDATEKQMREALTRANVNVDLDYDVGERGQLLSGGQAQRVSLARAFLSRARILLLDEPTSQVDAASEQAIVEALRSAAKDDPGLTMVLVTHRPAILALAQHVYVLEGGKLVEDACESAREDEEATR